MTTRLAHYDAATEALLHLTLQAPLYSEELEHIAEAARCLDQAKQARLMELLETRP